MNTKLTLNIDNNIIEEAKLYAKDNSISLSKLIENYLQSLTKKKSGKVKISPPDSIELKTVKAHPSPAFTSKLI